MNSDFYPGFFRASPVVVLNLKFLSFEFVSDFDIRYSDLFKAFVYLK
jgi:hypothetical protein